MCCVVLVEIGIKFFFGGDLDMIVGVIEIVVVW